MSQKIYHPKNKARHTKQISKKLKADLPMIPCPRCEKTELDEVKGGQVFCGSCGCHVSPKIFDRLTRG